MIIIYSITNTVNNKRYIGISEDYKNRKRVHQWAMKNNKHRNIKLQRAVNKYGYDNFRFEILDSLETSDRIEALTLENRYIVKYNSYKNGYNQSEGFEGSTLQKYSDERLEKMRVNMLGNTIWKGRKHTEETKAMIGIGNKGKKVSLKTRKKLSESRKGKFLGEDNHFYGKTHTEESKDKIRKKNGKPIICIETSIIYDSINQCAKEMNIDRKGIERVLNGKYEQAKGYTFKYISY